MKSLSAPLVICLFVTPHALADALPDDADEQALQSGEVIHESILRKEAGGAVRARFLFHERPVVLWEVLRAFDRTFEFVAGMRYSEEIEKSEKHALVRQRVKQHWLLPEMEYLAEFSYQPYTSIEYRQVEGDLKVLEGRWLFEWRPEERATLVTYEMRVQSKLPAPRWLIRRSLASDIIQLLRCLRARAGGSGSAAQERADLELCPETTQQD